MESKKVVIKDFKKYGLSPAETEEKNYEINFDGYLVLEVELDEVYQYIEERETKETEEMSDEELFVWVYNQNIHIEVFPMEIFQTNIGEIKTFTEYIQKFSERYANIKEDSTLREMYIAQGKTEEEYQNLINTIKEAYTNEVGEVGEKSDEELFIWNYNKDKPEEEQLANFEEFIEMNIEQAEKMKKCTTVHELFATIMNVNEETYNFVMYNIREKYKEEIKPGKIKEVIYPDGYKKENIYNEYNGEIIQTFSSFNEWIPYKKGTYNFTINTNKRTYIVPVNIEDDSVIIWTGKMNDEFSHYASVVNFSTRNILTIDSFRLYIDGSWIDAPEGLILSNGTFSAIDTDNLGYKVYSILKCNNKEVLLYQMFREE